MSLKRNVVANFASFAYLAIVGIVMVPAYVERLGVEAYGLVSFFIVLQTFFQLLDLGITPTMSREAAKFRGGGTDALSLRQLLRSFEIICGLIAVAGALALFLLAGWIASNWLRIENLQTADVELALRLMALVAGVRWISGLYRGVIAGFENQVWLAGFSGVMTTASFVLVLPVLDIAGPTVLVFFAYQSGIAFLELALLLSKAYRVLPRLRQAHTALSLAPARGVLQFALNMAFISSIWLALYNLDKLLLSKLLPLTEYAHFSIAVLLASGVVVISGPISTALLPRLAKLAAEKDETAFLHLYRASTQVIAVTVFPVCVLLAFFSEEILWAWTGNREIASHAGPILATYALGNGILAIAACAYYLQFGKGDLRLHVFGNLLFVVVLVPSLIWATLRFGAVGAGAAWLVSNAIYFFAWVPLVHHRFLAGQHMKWLMTDVLSPLLPALLGAIALRSGVRWPDDRLLSSLMVVASGVVLVLLAMAGSSVARNAAAGLRR